jgi:FkbM family methyltransferase
MCLDFRDNAAFRYLRYGPDYEADLAKVLLHSISRLPGSMFIDVGASYGFYTLVAGGIGRHGLLSKIFSYEPDARCVEALRKSVQANNLQGLVQVSQCLIGDFLGDAEFIRSAQGSTSNRSFSTIEGYFRTSDSQKMQVSTLDFEMKHYGVETSRGRFVVKIDVEGSEFRVLRGMKNLLTEASAVFVLFEFFPVAMREVGASPADLVSALSVTSWDIAIIRSERRWTSYSSAESLALKIKELYLENDMNPHFVADVLLGRGSPDLVVAFSRLTGAHAEWSVT